MPSFLTDVRTALDTGTFESLVLSKPRQRGAALKSVRVRRIALHGEAALSFTYVHASRNVTKNFDVDGGVTELNAMLDPAAQPSFAHATLHAGGEDLQLLLNRKGHGTLRRHRRVQSPQAAGPTAGLPVAHDLPGTRRLSLDRPFWVELGIADAEHRLVPAMARKWRQIDKFLEVLDHAFDALPAPSDGGDATPIRVVDFGSGKGYLTFAVHEHLRQRCGQPPQVTGVELRPELVALCNDVAGRCDMTGLRFEQGDLRSFAPAEVDVMIALHACDTATDHAIDLGLRAGASVLVCSPCCHKELRPQMHRPVALAGILRHGIHLGQEAEMVTDSLRALLLESCGYEAKVFEFVSLEHTSKNKMILATRRGDPGRADRALAEVRSVKDFYGIREQCLEQLLERRGALPGAGVKDARG